MEQNYVHIELQLYENMKEELKELRNANYLQYEENSEKEANINDLILELEKLLIENKQLKSIIDELQTEDDLAEVTNQQVDPIETFVKNKESQL